MRRRRHGLASPDATGWLVWAARFGYAACGFIYIAIGMVAAAVALGVGQEPTGSHGVMRFLARQPFAPLLLATLGIGLAGYAALNITGAISDPERRGLSIVGLGLRAMDILTGALYIALTFAVLGLLVGSSKRTDTARAVAEKLLELPFGVAILGLIGVSLIVGSVYLFVRALRDEFGEMLDKRSLSREARAAIVLAARAGTAARGVVFAICGALAISAAMSRSPQKIGDVDDALAVIREGAMGPLLLALMGAGFIAYGVYQLSKARYQRVVDSSRSRSAIRL
ncbi:MAG: DUF1206 domain-containing protein [Gemmatimonadales bacterium]